MFTLEQLRCFATVAEELHFGKAAEKLQMTQPPLSRQIQKLERILGFDLLIRNNRQVLLTPGGEAFLVEAKRLLRLAASAPNAAYKIASGQGGTVSIGFTATTALSMLDPLLRLIEKSLPEIETDIQELVSSEQVGKLLAGELDLGLVRDKIVRAELAIRLIHREKLIAAIPSEHPLSRVRRKIEPEDFSNQSVITYSQNGAGYFDNLMRRVLATVEFNSSLTTVQIHSMLALVAANRGLALVPESAKRFNIEGIRFREIKGWEHNSVELYAIWRTDYANPVMRHIIGVVSQIEPH